MRFINREYVRAHREKLFIFGDNLDRQGFGGQAASMRGEPNAIGVPTKKSPSYSDEAFFYDSEFEQNKIAIDRAFDQLTKTASDSTRAIVIPASGIGTGRAQLDRRAPLTFEYIMSRLNELSDLL